MKRLKKIVLSSFLGMTLLGACGNPRDPAAPTERLLPRAPLRIDDPAEFAGGSLEELTVVFFPKGLSRENWRQVFRQTSLMREARSELLRLSALEGEETAEAYDHAQANYLQLASAITNQTALLLPWTPAESCRFVAEEATVRLKCEQASDALPQAVTPLIRRIPSPKDLRVFPWIEWEFFGTRPRDQTAYRFVVRLQEEPRREPNGSRRFTGEAELLDGSLPDADRFGYAEFIVRSESL